jgi:putative SOS response-associated peptidase YedK
MLARRRFERRGKHAVRRDQNAQAGIWENWKQPASGQWMRTLAIVTTDEAVLWDLLPTSSVPDRRAPGGAFT